MTFRALLDHELYTMPALKEIRGSSPTPPPLGAVVFFLNLFISIETFPF